MSDHDLKERIPDADIEAAKEELRELCVHVYDDDLEEDFVAFMFGSYTEDEYLNKIYFADMHGEKVQEKVVDGSIVNPRGVRQDVHDILRKYRFVTDWQTHTVVVVYSYYDAPGLNHHNIRKHLLFDVAWDKAVEEGFQTGKPFSDEYWAVKEPWMADEMPDDVERYIFKA